MAGQQMGPRDPASTPCQPLPRPHLNRRPVIKTGIERHPGTPTAASGPQTGSTCSTSALAKAESRRPLEGVPVGG